MKPSPIAHNEKDRLGALQRAQIIDTPPEKHFDELTLLAAKLFGVPMAYLGFVDFRRIWLKSQIGVPATEFPRDRSFAAYSILVEGPFVIPDATQDANYRNSIAVTGAMGVRFYASHPVMSGDGFPIGVLAVVGQEAKNPTSEQLEALATLANQVSQQLALRARLWEAETVHHEVRESEERFRQIAENTREVIWMSDAEKSRILYVNPAYEQVWGRTQESLYRNALSFVDAIHVDDRARVADAIAGQKGRGYHEEYRVVRPDGEVRWVRDRAFPIRNENGKTYRVCGIAEDVTDRRNTEEALKESHRRLRDFADALKQSEERYRVVSETATDGILTFDPYSRILFANQAWEQILGYTSAELVGQSLMTIVPERFRENHVMGMRRLRQTRRPAIRWTSMEFAGLHKSGREVPLEVSLGSTAAGPKMTLTAIVRDISTRKQIERQISDQQQIIVNSSKMSALGEMAGGVAHEINNPLTIILGKAGQIRNLVAKPSFDPQMISGAAEKIEATVMRISKIVKGLRTFAREAENDPFEPTRIRALLEDSLEMCQERFRYHGVDLRVGQFREDLELECRPAQLVQLLVNLLNNAYDAVENLSTKWIAIEVRDLGDAIELSISDSGPGIRPEMRQKIFQPFFTTKEVGRGTGLGLSISKGIVESHRGEIHLDGSSQHTRFLIKLPTRCSDPYSSAA